MSMDAEIGLFGWLNPKHALNAVFGLGFMGTFWGSSVGYLLIMKYYSPIVCMNALLYEPIIAQILGCMLNLD